MFIIPLILALLLYNLNEMIFGFKDSILMSVTSAIETNKIICVCTHILSLNLNTDLLVCYVSRFTDKEIEAEES